MSVLNARACPCGLHVCGYSRWVRMHMRLLRLLVLIVVTMQAWFGMVA